MSSDENEFNPVGLIVATIVFCTVFYPINYINNEFLSWILFGAAIAAAAFAYKYFGNYKKGLEDVASNAALHAKSVRDAVSSAVDDADLRYYAAAEKEVDTNQYDHGLWAQALVKCNGDESKRKISYIVLRVAQMKRGSH